MFHNGLNAFVHACGVQNITDGRIDQRLAVSEIHIDGIKKSRVKQDGFFAGVMNGQGKKKKKACPNELHGMWREKKTCSRNERTKRNNLTKRVQMFNRRVKYTIVS